MEDKDPSDMGFKNFTHYVQQAEEMDLGKLTSAINYHNMIQKGAKYPNRACQKRDWILNQN
jgi:hypothetical protein